MKILSQNICLFGTENPTEWDERRDAWSITLPMTDSKMDSAECSCYLLCQNRHESIVWVLCFLLRCLHSVRSHCGGCLLFPQHLRAPWQEVAILSQVGPLLLNSIPTIFLSSVSYACACGWCRSCCQINFIKELISAGENKPGAENGHAGQQGCRGALTHSESSFLHNNLPPLPPTPRILSFI